MKRLVLLGGLILWASWGCGDESADGPLGEQVGGTGGSTGGQAGEAGTGGGQVGGTGNAGSGPGGAGGSPNHCTGNAPSAIVLTDLVTGLSEPTKVVTDPTKNERLFILERAGRVRVKDGSEPTATALDISSEINTYSEGGLLGIAMHPNFGENGERRIYLHYTVYRGTQEWEMSSVIAEYQISASNPNQIEPAAKELLKIEQPAPNHNGGDLAFGPDGYLYIPLGDGGGGDDQFGAGQDPSNELGSILRIDVENHPTPPPGNHPDGEYVYHWGVRNPYRISFDRATGDLYFGDVGQDAWEEVNAVSPASGRHNFGWGTMEGNHCRVGNNCDRTGLTLPIAEYSHEGQGGLSVTGGVVYRGSQIPSLYGRYLYADHYINKIQTLRWTGTETCDEFELPFASGSVNRIIHFGEDNQGELLIVSAGYGTVHRVSAQ